jgi:serine/threonine-protein kinase HipA
MIFKVGAKMPPSSTAQAGLATRCILPSGRLSRFWPDRNLWRLSPAFDINPSPERFRELKTWISHDTGPDMTIDALMSVIAYFRITPGRAKEMLSRVVSAVEDWRKTGHALGMTDDELDPFADAFEHVERAAAKKLL